MLPFFYFIYLNNFYTTKNNDYIFLSNFYNKDGQKQSFYNRKLKIGQILKC